MSVFIGNFGTTMKRMITLLPITLIAMPFFMSLAEDKKLAPVKVEHTTEEEDLDFLTEEDFQLVYEDTYTIDDPFENVNRTMFHLTKGVDIILIKPAAQIYRHTIPEVGRDRVDSALANLKEPINFANSIFQGNPDKASNAMGRFLVNSLLGLGGIFDVASEAGIERVQEDFGKTLGHYNIGTGPYIYIPLLGPSSPRDILGRGVDYAMDPFVYSVHVDGVYIRNGIEFINTRESLLEVTDNIERTSIDEYVTIRNIYAQKRKAKK